MKKHTLLKNAGFKGQEEFYNLTGIPHHYQWLLLTQEPDFFKMLVEKYKHFIGCKSRILHKMRFSITHDDVKVEMTCYRADYISYLAKARLSREQIKQLIVNDIPDINEIADEQAGNDVDRFDKLP